MAFSTYDHIDGRAGKSAMALYHEAFPKAGRKPDTIIRAMFAKQMSVLHTETMENEIVAMAISGVIPKANALLIDYLAVRSALRGRGIGRRFVGEIASWARDEKGLNGVIIEAEADDSRENDERIRFWERCGFIPTEYVHKYIWVPEKYRAMYLPFSPYFRVTDSGESLFGHIGDFHKKAFAR